MWTLLLLILTNTTANPGVFGRPAPEASRPALVTLSATGIGYPPRHMRGAQARLMAQRAAEVVAVRNLSAKLGYPASSRIGGFRYVSVKHLPHGVVEVTVETTVTGGSR